MSALDAVAIAEEEEFIQGEGVPVQAIDDSVQDNSDILIETIVKVHSSDYWCQ